jgi:glutamine synthetase
MTGLDGVAKRTDPGEPMDDDIFELPPEQTAKIKTAPESLEKVLEELETDQESLLKGGVFTKDLIETWIDYKRRRENDQIRLRPHPYEFYLYFDV